MSLKATAVSKYRRPSGWVLVYAVSGTIAELDEYVAIMAARANKTIDQWQRTPAGAPLYFIQLNNLLRNGDVPQPQYDLVKSHDGLNIYTDTTKQENARNLRLMAKQEDAEAQIMAEIRLGVRTISAQPTAVRTPPTVTPTTKSDDIADTIVDNLGEEAEVVETEAAGTETLG